jgi:predicted extracellular nuclease
VNTAGFENINVSYLVRDIDSNTDDAVQQLALHFRAGSSGLFTNVPAAYIADASVGSGTKDTPINVTLPSEADDQPVLMLRIMTTNATGSDEWLGIDDISITGTAIVTAPELVINEIDYDQPSTDTAEFVELKNNGTSAVDLTGFSLELVNGSGTAVYQTIALPAEVLAPGDYYVICSDMATVSNCDLSEITSIQNGAPDAVGLRYEGDLIDAVSYEGNTGAPYTEGSGVGLSDGGDYSGSISRCPDGIDTNQNDIDLINTALPTPGERNDCPIPEIGPSVESTDPGDGATIDKTGNILITFSEPVNVVGTWFDITCTESGVHTAAVTDTNPVFTLDPDIDFSPLETCTVTVYAANISDVDTDDPPDLMEVDFSFTFNINSECGKPFTPIYDIQGAGLDTPYSDQTVITEGVVVGDFQEGKSGFFIQDIAGDGNPSTSDGIFVYAPSSINVSFGDLVRVEGIAEEEYGLTRIDSSDVFQCDTNIPLPPPVELSLPVTSLDGFEPYEGMYVTFPQDLVISEYFNFDRFGEIVLTSERHLTPTAFVEPGAAAVTASQEYLLDRITLDDGRDSQNPDPAFHPNGLEFTTFNRFRGGDLVTNLTGVLDYGYSLYRIQPTQGADYTSVNLRTETPAIIPGDIKVASFNVLNYFTTINTGDEICGPVAFVDVLGRVGEDPGTYWGIDPVTTLNHTLVRKDSVCNGDIEPIDVFDPTAEWDSYASDTISDLGSHTTTCGVLSDLIISEYVEGSSNNKAIEIYNGTGSTVDLQNYKIHLYTNGGGSPTNTLEWDTETLLADGDVYVIANPSASAEILAIADTTSTITYFNGDDVIALQKAGVDGAECRGADTLEEFERQKTKIVEALYAIDADIVGLMEIENDRLSLAPDYPVADLVAGLNAKYGAEVYDYIATGAIGTDAIKVALIYKPDKVTPVGDYAILDSMVDPRFLDDYNRPTLAQTFIDNIVGESITVAVNHLKSKGSDCDDVGDPDLDDGQGNCNLTRLAAAQAEVDWLEGDATGTGVDKYLIIGDLNSYDKEDPIDAIRAGSDDILGTGDDFFDMLYQINGEDVYGYVYDGQVGYLDYALVNQNLLEFVTDANFWHSNADEPDIIDYDMSFKADAQDALWEPNAYRASDHDPVIITLTFNQSPAANDDFYETDQDVTLEIPAPGVLVNDMDLNEFDQITLDIASQPENGSVVLNQDGSFTYIPNPGFFGEDVFAYYLIAIPPDTRGEFTDIAYVTIKVHPKYQYFMPLMMQP